MALEEGFEPAVGMLSGGFSNILAYAWVLIPIIIVTTFILGFWFYKQVKLKNTQWTHTLKVRRVMQDGRLSDTLIHKMRRFPLIKKAEVFELEKPFLGSYLLPELEEYSGNNEFSIILDKNNRIYTCKGEFFIKDKSSIHVSAKHSEIDIERQNLKADFQNINKISKRVEWSTIAKYAFMLIGIVAIMIVLIVGIQNWSQAQQYKADEAKANEAAMLSLAQAMKTIEATVNTQQLELTKLLEQLYGTKNIQSVLNKE